MFPTPMFMKHFKEKTLVRHGYLNAAVIVLSTLQPNRFKFIFPGIQLLLTDLNHFYVYDNQWNFQHMSQPFFLTSFQKA